MSHLFEPLQIGRLALANRIVIAPMCQYSADQGTPGDWHMIHLGHLALSGAGLLVVEATAVSAEGRITPGDLGLYSDANEAGLARILKAIRAHAPIAVAMQLAHAGRKASSRAPWEGGAQIPSDATGGWKAEAPSALPHAAGEEPPQALDSAGLERVRAAFVQAAQRAVRLGLDGLEIHAAHGYLLHQFLSPLANRREDRYGGSLENRMRFPLEVFDAVRAAVPDRASGLGARLRHRLGARRLGHRGHRRIRARAEGARMRRDPRVERRRLADAEDSGGAGLPGALRRACEGRSRVADDCRRTHHRARAGRVDHRAGRGGCCLPGPRHAVRPALALACRRPPRRPVSARPSSTGARSRASTRTSSRAQGRDSVESPNRKSPRPHLRRWLQGPSDMSYTQSRRVL